MATIYRKDSSIDLGTFNGAVTQQLTDVLKRPTMQHQMHRKTMPKGVTGDPKWCPTRSFYQAFDMPINCLSTAFKQSLTLLESVDKKILLDPALQDRIPDRNEAHWRAH